jgi:hypothetical protein
MKIDRGIGSEDQMYRGGKRGGEKEGKKRGKREKRERGGEKEGRDKDERHMSIDGAKETRVKRQRDGK